MALNAYLKLTGKTQGEIKGSNTQKGREDQIMVIGYNHEVVSPRDAASGLPTGKRQHKPLTITKEIDQATPLLMQALVTNEQVTKAQLFFWTTDAAGAEKQHYTIELENASIAGIRSEMLNNKVEENMRHKEREHVSFCYQKITWIWNDGGKSASDDWESPVT